MVDESTDRDLVGIARRAVEAIDSGDLELAVKFFTADCRIETPPIAAFDKTYVGRAGVREWYGDFFDVFAEGARYRVEEILANGDSFVVARVAIVGHGAGSNAPLHLRWIVVWWFGDAEIARAVAYVTRAEALRDVGLEK